MEKKEQDIKNIIDDKTKDVSVPETLQPEQIEKMLQRENVKNKQRNKKIYRTVEILAACAVFAVGIYAYGNLKKQPEQNGENESAEISKSHTVASAQSYDEIYSYIEAQQEELEVLEDGALYDTGVMTAESSAESFSSKQSEAAARGDYLETNVRQEGVDEGDVAKTDGKYLFVLKNDSQKIAIVDTDGNMKEVGEIEVEENHTIYEIYLLPEKQKLVLVGSAYPEELSEVITYDISDISSPQELGRVTQSGYYQSSRLVDGYVYLFSEYYAGNDIEKDEPKTFVPLVNDEVVKETDIYMPLTQEGRQYEVLTSINVNQPEVAADSKAIFTKGGQIYVSNENIYYYETEWQAFGDRSKTTVRKVSYKDGKLKAKAQGTFAGYINDSFSIDEYEGRLRVVTTSGDTNAVYVLDEDLEIIGEIEGLAKDERVYSARFMGDTAYFVTFRETDPLFTVDLSDPENPTIIGQLKIPGFSEYLHFYGEGKLLGIGMNVDEETQVTDGVKLTIFDISDKTDVKEEATYVLKDVYSTDVFYDYKAVLIDVEKNRIGFAAYPAGNQKYYLFSYDEKEKRFICNMEEEINGNSSSTVRGLYINDTLYVVQGNVIEAYSLRDYKKVDDLIL
ncbi:beta-propeller domain-containing protein [Faecalicatena contorta]|uniref:beta-propeller domain-containing protein n=1 Tax=Faecalicatena contorta TaxID=39482 RepID=UPI001F25BFC6|nr:beta-propeller domain-containing protein [Faecalicatena contorta]MCF2553921.1 beta-propeller domain-containing protein [Faecalicatena contorta]